MLLSTRRSVWNAERKSAGFSLLDAFSRVDSRANIHGEMDSNPAAAADNHHLLDNIRRSNSVWNC